MNTTENSQIVTLPAKAWVSMALLSLVPALGFGLLVVAMNTRLAIIESSVDRMIAIQESVVGSNLHVLRLESTININTRRIDKLEDKIEGR